MTRLKVALVDLDGKPVAEWVPEKLRNEGIDLVIHDCKTRDDLAQAASDAEVVWTFGGSRILQNGNLEAAPKCWAILRTGSGTDNVPVDEATRKGIVVANTPQAFSDCVSDHAIALLFAAVRQIASLDRAVRRGEWSQTRLQPLSSVEGRTLGLVGFGRAAQAVARKLSGFAVRVLAHDPFCAPEVFRNASVSSATLNQVLAESDFVSLHCPLTDKTRHLIGERELSLMKPTAVLINTSRGPVVDEAALILALSKRQIAAAALDVVESEPLTPESPLLQLENVVVTPHHAGNSANGVELRWKYSVETILAFAARRWPSSCVNPTVQPRVELRRGT